MNIEMTRHAKEDRADRLTFIALHVGFGEVVVEKVCANDCAKCLTNTGVMLVKGVGGVLITAYIADREQVSYMYPSSRVPEYLWKRVQKNKKYLDLQNSVTF